MQYPLCEPDGKELQLILGDFWVTSGKGCWEISLLCYMSNPRVQKLQCPKQKPSLREKVVLSLPQDWFQLYPNVLQGRLFQMIRTWEVSGDKAVRGQFWGRAITQVLALPTPAQPSDHTAAQGRLQRSSLKLKKRQNQLILKTKLPRLSSIFIKAIESNLLEYSSSDIKSRLHIALANILHSHGWPRYREVIHAVIVKWAAGKPIGLL